MKKTSIIVSLLFTNIVFAQLDIGGYVKNYDAVLLNGKNDYLILRSRLRLDFNYIPSDNAIGYASFDVKNDQITDHNALEMNLREMYIDLYFDNYDIRIGKQQIVWGKADGLFITDIINPLDLREFILADFEDIRMGVNSIKGQVYWRDNRLEGIWILEFVPAKFSLPGAQWAFHTPIDEISATIPDSLIEINELIEPEKRLRNSEYGLRYSMFVKGIDLTLSYFRTWEDYPVFRQNYQSTQDPLAPFRVRITPEYDHLTVLGGTFSSSVGSFVIRGEGALYQGRHFYTANVNDGDRVVLKNFLHYMAGGEITPGDAFISGQFIQEIIMDYDDQLLQDEIVNQGTFLVSRSFLNEAVKPEIFLIYDFTHDDYLGRLLVRYFPADGMEIILGADILGGKKNWTLFGQFDDNDHVYLKVKYSF